MDGFSGRLGLAVVGIGIGVTLAVVVAATGADGPTPLVVGTLVAASFAVVPSIVMVRPGSTADDASSRAVRGREALHREFDRSRRYGHSLTLVVVRAGAAGGPAGGGDPGTAPEDRLGAHLRLVDVTWREDGAVLALLPETDSEAARRLVERIRADDPALVPVGSTGIATFPTEVMTIRALVDRATRAATADTAATASIPGSAATERSAERAS